MLRSSNGPRPRNGRPANHPSCHINYLAEQVTPLAGEAGTFRLRHDDRVKKGAPRYLNSYPFPFPLSLSLATGTGKGGISKRILLREGNGHRAHY
jgi:hypothetical protein